MNLTQTSEIFKKGVKILIGFVIFYYILTLVLIPVGKQGFALLFPPKDPPNIMFGMLDPLEFTSKETVSSKVTYILNTKDGKIPTFPKKMTVYKYNPVPFSYQAGKNAQNTAAFLGFTDTDLASDIKGSSYRWKSQISGGNLQININNLDLILDTDLRGKSSNFPPGSLTPESAANYAITFLNATGRYTDPEYKDHGFQKTYLGQFTSQGIVETTLPREAQIARVDFFRQIEDFPVLGPDPKKGLIHVILKRPDEKGSPYNYPIIESHIRTIKGPSAATYPLVPAKQVLDEVMKGNGIISSVEPKGASPFENYIPVQIDKIYINNIYLAYYDNSVDQQFLQPIYVFEGNYTSTGGGAGNMVIYYPAVDGKYVKKASQETPTAR